MQQLIAEVATLKENNRWQNKKLESIESKVDALIEQKSNDKYFKGKVFGAIAMLSFIGNAIGAALAIKFK